MNSRTHFLTHPGLASSGPQHWQTIWEDQSPELFKRVEQDNWDWPERKVWVERLQEYVAALTGPTVLVAHSMACITVAYWARKYSSPYITGALLVAPADVERSKRLNFVVDFCPIPEEKLPFESIVVASSNDPFADIDRSRKFAMDWGSNFVNLGEKGHINAISKLGDWKEGKQLLKKLSAKNGILFENESLINY